MTTFDPKIAGLGVTPQPKADPSLAASNDNMGKEQFLQLLTAQLQHQDPLEPQKNHEFVAQLAQFSGLEQQISVNKNLQGLMASQSAMANAQLSGLIGKEIVSKGGTVQVKPDGASPFNFELKGHAQDVRITIFDEKNQAVATRELGKLPAGPHQVGWTGQNNQNIALPPGTYRFEVTAKDANDKAVTTTSQGKGVVSGVTFENGFPELVVGNGKVLPGDIVKIVQNPVSP